MSKYFLVLFTILLTSCQSNTKEDIESKSDFIDLGGVKMHYTKSGKGDPILFVHGNFTHSYLWRNITPRLSKVGECISVDLMGMGKSDKPAIEYSIKEQARYLEQFIDAMGLENITLVGHEWGASLCLDYLSRTEHKVKALVMIEPVISGISSQEMMAMKRPLIEEYFSLRQDSASIYKILNQNYLLTNMLRLATEKPLQDKDYLSYMEPYPNPEDRIPLLSFFEAFPIDNTPRSSAHFISLFRPVLFTSTIPKLLISSDEDYYLSKEGIDYLNTNVKNLTISKVGKAGLLIPEDQPEKSATAITEWYTKYVNKN